MRAVWRRTRLIGLLLAVPLALTSIASAASPASGGGDRQGRAACLILNASRFPGIPHVADLSQIGVGCTGGQCLEQAVDPNTHSQICHYARSAVLSVGCRASKRKANSDVENLIRHHGWRRVRLRGVGAAAVESDSVHAKLALSLRAEFVGFVMAASSDDDPHPTWSGVEHETIQGARNFIGPWQHLKHICPKS